MDGVGRGLLSHGRFLLQWMLDNRCGDILRGFR
jgi:hypothetical protein